MVGDDQPDPPRPRAFSVGMSAVQNASPSLVSDGEPEDFPELSVVSLGATTSVLGDPAVDWVAN